MGHLKPHDNRANFITLSPAGAKLIHPFRKISGVAAEKGEAKMGWQEIWLYLLRALPPTQIDSWVNKTIATQEIEEAFVIVKGILYGSRSAPT